MTFEEALEYVRRFADLERKTDYQYDKQTFGLERMARLCKALGNPERQFRSVHVAGTKGKGSVCAFCESILRAHGLKTGLYTSPHLIDFRERIRVAGKILSQAEFAELVPLVRAAIDSMPDGEQMHFFELYTALGFLHFARSKVDIAVCEVGMGGRLDATNVLEPEVTVITPISLEHTRYLGDTVEAIAGEKAGILKPGVPAVVNAGQASRPVLAQCREIGAPVYEYRQDFVARMEPNASLALRLGEREFDGLHLGLEGRFQVENAACGAMAASLILGNKLNRRALADGLANVKWPGRFQVIDAAPPIVLDGAMNGASALALRGALVERFPHRGVTLVLGVSRDKDPGAILSALLPGLCETLILTQADNPRAMPTEELQRAVDFDRKVLSANTVPKALELARENTPPNDVICVTGSLYVVGEAMQALGLESVVVGP